MTIATLEMNNTAADSKVVVEKESLRSGDIPVLMVVKRDGTKVPFDRVPVERAIALAYFETRVGGVNPWRDNADARYGLDEDSFSAVRKIASRVEEQVRLKSGLVPASIEEVQNLVQRQMLSEGGEVWINVVMNFIDYRLAQANTRPISHKENGLSEYIALSRYCRYSRKLGRRELWPEAVARVSAMHLRRFNLKADESIDSKLQGLGELNLVEKNILSKIPKLGTLREALIAAFDRVSKREILGSMRSMQFGGPAIEKNEARIYNCTFSHADRIEFFGEFFWLLLSGAGAGFSVQTHHVQKLPEFATRPKNEISLKVKHVVISDDIEGWSNAVYELFLSFVLGYKVEFAYHEIRDRGKLLKTAGGNAPGHLPLKQALEKVEAILKPAAGRRLRAIEVYDICMHLACAVLSGGIRRSATICLFSPEDQEMVLAKTPGQFAVDSTDADKGINPQRAASNNSAVIHRTNTDRAVFERIVNAAKQFGEPGFFFTNNLEYGANPCVEILLNPVLTLTAKIIEKLRAYGYDAEHELKHGRLEVGRTITGWQFCNLCTTNASTCESADEFYARAAYAALIGTCQADYTNIPFLGPVTRVLNEREALLGVSICGVLDRPEIFLSPDVLETGAAVVKTVNTAVAAVLGINRAARTTCVKPEGTASLLLGASSGIGAHHDTLYFRRVQANPTEKPYQGFKAANPHMTEASVYGIPGSTDVITFPVEAPAGAILRKDLDVEKQLSIIKRVQRHWVMAGQQISSYTDGHHNVSNTVEIKDKEWELFTELVWDNREYYTGIAMISDSGDKSYPQAPRESLATAADIARWNGLVYNPVDYTQLGEEDEAAGSEHRGAGTACAGGKCDIV